MYFKRCEYVIEIVDDTSDEYSHDNIPLAELGRLLKASQIDNDLNNRSRSHSPVSPVIDAAEIQSIEDNEAIVLNHGSDALRLIQRSYSSPSMSLVLSQIYKFYIFILLRIIYSNGSIQRQFFLNFFFPFRSIFI